MEKHVDKSDPTPGRLHGMTHAILSPRAETLIPSLFLALLLFNPLSQTAMTFLLPSQWQISGFYLDGLFYGLLLTLAAAWLLSIAIRLSTRQFSSALRRIIVIPPILLAAVFISLLPKLLLPSTISGWPLDSAYSESRDKHFILAYEPIPTDTIYRVFSAKTSLWNPIWRVEMAGAILDYSEDGSLTENPHLILSKDEQLLVVARGGHLTDAILIDSKQPLTQYVPWTEDNRSEHWQRRSDTIRRLLATHEASATPPTPSLTESDIRQNLSVLFQRISPELERAIPEEGWAISCAVNEIKPARQGRRQVLYTVTCNKADSHHSFLRRMSLIEDAGRLLIVEQDTGLMWSGNDEKKLCEYVRSALLRHAPDGTYLDGQ